MVSISSFLTGRTGVLQALPEVKLPNTKELRQKVQKASHVLIQEIKTKKNEAFKATKKVFFYQPDFTGDVNDTQKKQTFRFFYDGAIQSTKALQDKFRQARKDDSKKARTREKVAVEVASRGLALAAVGVETGKSVGFIPINIYKSIKLAQMEVEIGQQKGKNKHKVRAKAVAKTCLIIGKTLINPVTTLVYGTILTGIGPTTLTNGLKSLDSKGLKILNGLNKIRPMEVSNQNMQKVEKDLKSLSSSNSHPDSSDIITEE